MSLQSPIDEQELISRIVWRVVPIVVAIYLIAIVDRANIGFAKLQMVTDLKMSEQVYGLASSLFFIGYLVFEIPSVLAVNRFGAKMWFARILLSWGLLTMALAYTYSGSVFAALRFLVGAAEAGAYPGIIFYFTLWFPQEHRARVIGLLTLGSAFGNMLGSLMGGPLLDLDGALGLRGWQWVFLATGIPAVILTPIVLIFLPNKPENASFLSAREKSWLTDAVNRGTVAPKSHGNPLKVLLDPRALFFAAFYMLILMSLYGVIYWLPTVVKGFGVTGTVNGLLTSVPWAIAAVLLLILPPRLRREDVVLTAIAVISAIGLACFFLSTMLPQNWMRFVAMSIGTPCISLLFPCFWFLPCRYFSGAQAATAIAAISSLGNIGGFLAQNLMPWVAQSWGSAVMAMLVPALCLVATGLAALGMKLTSALPAPAAQRA